MTSEEERLISGQAWEDWCDRLKGVGRSILAEGFPDSPRERTEGFRWLTRLVTHATQLEVEAGDPLHPFCGAVTMTSTPEARMSTHTVPDATQSSTNSPPTACTASATAFRYPSGSIMPDDVSTWGAKTTSGFCASMVASTSSRGAGANGDAPAPSLRRALSTTSEAGMPPASNIWVQR